MFKLSPNLTSFKRFLISPNCTCEFTTPSLNNSLYLCWDNSPLVPTCIVPKASLNALPTSFGFSKNIPLAAEKPVAEKKFLKCVTGDNTVFAICAAPLGAKIKFLYAHVPSFSTPVAPSLGSNKNLNESEEEPKASAIGLDVYKPCNGLTAKSSLKKGAR